MRIGPVQRSKGQELGPMQFVNEYGWVPFADLIFSAAVNNLIHDSPIIPGKTFCN